jgi:PAS domain S-box-containing protein
MNRIRPSHRDISERQLDGDKTRCLSLATLAKLVECSPEAMVATDRSGEIVWVNAQTEKMFGYTRYELLGQSVEVLVPDRFREILPAYRRAFVVEPGILRTGHGLELDGRRKDGTELPIEE